VGLPELFLNQLAQESRMISDSDKKSIISTARKYNVSRVLLFGSSLSDKKEASDIDLAVEGIEPADFFSFYGEKHFLRRNESLLSDCWSCRDCSIQGKIRCFLRIEIFSASRGATRISTRSCPILLKVTK
jgi:predicted nucleotidyltransferase